MKASQLQSKISRFCSENGYYYNKIVVASGAGMPDCLVIINGVTYFFEVKIGGDRLSKLQKVTIDEINKDRELAFVVKSYDEFIDAVKKIT